MVHAGQCQRSHIRVPVSSQRSYDETNQSTPPGDDRRRDQGKTGSLHFW